MSVFKGTAQALHFIFLTKQNNSILNLLTLILHQGIPPISGKLLIYVRSKSILFFLFLQNSFSSIDYGCVMWLIDSELIMTKCFGTNQTGLMVHNTRIDSYNDREIKLIIPM